MYQLTRWPCVHLCRTSVNASKSAEFPPGYRIWVVNRNNEPMALTVLCVYIILVRCQCINPSISLCMYECEWLHSWISGWFCRCERVRRGTFTQPFYPKPLPLGQNVAQLFSQSSKQTSSFLSAHWSFRFRPGTTAFHSFLVHFSVSFRSRHFSRIAFNSTPFLFISVFTFANKPANLYWKFDVTLNPLWSNVHSL